MHDGLPLPPSPRILGAPPFTIFEARGQQPAPHSTHIFSRDQKRDTPPLYGAFLALIWETRRRISPIEPLKF